MNIPERWTSIAFEKNGKWIPEPDAPFTVKEAQALRYDGHLLIAQRRAQPSLAHPVPPMQIVVKKR